MSKKIRLQSVACRLFSIWDMLGILATATGLRAGQWLRRTKGVAVPSALRRFQATSELRKYHPRPIQKRAQSRARSSADHENSGSRKTPKNAPAESLQKSSAVPQEFRDAFLVSRTEQVAGTTIRRSRNLLADGLILKYTSLSSHRANTCLRIIFNFTLRKWPRGDSDAELAAHARRGRRTLPCILYNAQSAAPIAMLTSTKRAASSSEQIDKAPRPFVIVALSLPGGLNRVQAYSADGWMRVSPAYPDLRNQPSR